MNPRAVILMCVIVCVVFANVSADDKTDEIKALWEKFEHPENHVGKPGSAESPGGGEWDSQYRALLQPTSDDAVDKGYGSYEDASKTLLEDCMQGEANLKKHMQHLLFVKHYSSKYRKEPATKAMEKLWAGMIELKVNGKLPGDFWTAAVAKPGDTGDTGDGATASPAKPALPFDNRTDLTIYRDVAYDSKDPKTQLLDAYLVKSDTPTTVLLEIHGGGWRRGSKSRFADEYKGGFIDSVLDAGISVISIDYRKTTDGHPMPAQMEDAARALQFVRSKAAEWNIDPARIAATGGSAGAHLSCWLAFHDDLADAKSDDPVARQSTRLSCVIERAGPIDLTRVDPVEMGKLGERGGDFAKAFEAAFNCKTTEFQNEDVQKLIKYASPSEYVTKDDPPVMMIYGGSGELAKATPADAPKGITDPHSPWFGVLLKAQLDAAGVECLFLLQSPDNATQIDFLKKHLQMEEGE